MKKILVTGATGFVGRAVLGRTILDRKYQVLGSVRRNDQNLVNGAESILVGNLSSDTDWKQALTGVNVIIHTAARVHVMRETTNNPLTEFRLVNVAGTLNLARQAIAAGVRRFIFISSIKVNGEETEKNHPFTENHQPTPTDPYGISKFEAETGLFKLASQSGLEVVILRPPLIYGPEVKGNFLTLLKSIYRGIPLPLGYINNERSFISIQNFVDLIILCIDHQKASGQIFLVSDGTDVSTPALIKKLAEGMNQPARLIPFPKRNLTFLAKLLGKQQQAQRLLGSLQVDSRKTRDLLSWTPPLSVDEGLRETAKWYKMVANETNS